MGQCCCIESQPVKESAQTPIPLTVAQKSKLSSITLNETKQFSFEGLYLYGKVVECYDGDTCRIAFYYKNEIVQLSCRMNGYDSPEMKIPASHPDRVYLKDLACKARDRLKDLCKSSVDNLVKIKFGKFDLYGRPLVDIYVKEMHINSVMLQEGHGNPYNGKKKLEWCSPRVSKK